MKANYRERVRNLLCVLTGVTVIVTGVNPTVVDAVAFDSSDNLLNAGAEAAMDVDIEEETEKETETTAKAALPRAPRGCSIV